MSILVKLITLQNLVLHDFHNYVFDNSIFGLSFLVYLLNTLLRCSTLPNKNCNYECYTERMIDKIAPKKGEIYFKIKYLNNNASDNVKRKWKIENLT